jgi:hypothetical protein
MEGQIEGEFRENLLKNYNIYKLLARENLDEIIDEDKLIDNYLKLILSNSKSVYLQAPILGQDI